MMKTTLILAGIVGALCAGAVAEEPAKALLAPPQTLRDAEGRPETGLVDPFVGGGRRDEEAGAGGLMRTGLGELSGEFKILAIVVPADTNQVPTALLQMNNQTEPVLVHPDDVVMVDRSVPTGTGAGARRGRFATRPAAGRRATAQGMSMEEKLKDYVFYLHVKSIRPNYLEVYHNKKRPDETIILNW